MEPEMEHELNNNILYLDERLLEALEVLDQLHTAASDGELASTLTLSKRELAALLQEFIFTAQETLQELNNKPAMPALRILERPLPPHASTEQRQA
ncbi:MAG: hypothetical protein OHK0046_31900 [Anaerolineae bacterium]